MQRQISMRTRWVDASALQNGEMGGMKHQFALVAVLVLAASVFVGSVAQADTEKATFDYHIGDGFGGVLNTTGDKAMAENGDVVTVKGGGTFDVVTKTASGKGTFKHQFTGGSATGTWTATGLLAFQSYGDGTPQGLPASLFGGRAALAVMLTPDAHPDVHVPGILQVECLLGSPPAGAEEGVRLLAKGVINFNKTVIGSGETVFVMH